MSRRERAAAARLGARAEEIVRAHLRAEGYAIVGRNVRVGRREIDVIARRGRTVAFVEVRGARSDRQRSPLETIGPRKIRLIREAAAAWLGAAGLRGVAIRFDAAAVVFDQPTPRLDYRADAF